MNIHVSQNGKEMGPYSVDEVNTMLNVGSLHPDDMAWHDELPEWTKLCNVGGVHLQPATSNVSSDTPSINAVPTNNSSADCDPKTQSILDLYMPLNGGEQIISCLEGDAYSTSSNLLLAILGFIQRLVDLLTGQLKKMHIIVTDSRVITVETSNFFWVFDNTLEAKSLKPKTVSQVGYALGRSLLVFKSHFFLYSLGSTSYKVRTKDGKDKVYEMVKAVMLLPNTGSK